MLQGRLEYGWLLALVLAIALPTAPAGAASFKHENKPQNLKALFELIHQTVHIKQDAKQATALFQSMMPDQVRARKALKDNVAPETTKQILEMYQKMPVTEEAVRKLARPEQTEVQVHGSTTEDIIRYREGSVAFNEFPGGAKRVAEQLLRPGMTFYEVEYLVPGKDAGMKYHLLYWDGKQWTMLGPVWRVLKQ